VIAVAPIYPQHGLLFVDTGADGFDGCEEIPSVPNQIFEMQIKLGEAEARLAHIDYDLKPENIERALVGIGSTKPEELRGQSRQILSLEKAALFAKLQLLREIKSRLEMLSSLR